MPVSADDTNVTITVGENTCTIALQGATVHSYIHKGVERLFHSTKSPLEGPTAIRGGIPICWPIFGPPDAKDERFNKLKQHGFARTTKWEYDESESADTKEGGAKAVFKLKSTPETEAIYGPAFFLAYTVTLTPDSLVVSLYVLNPSTTDPLPFQALFHAYLRLPPTILPPAVTAIGLEGLPFVDKVQGGAKGLEQRTVITVDGPKGEVDRVYFGAPDALGLSWEGGEVKVTKTGLADVVLWNPGPEKGATIGDMEEGGANRYVCLEPGQVGTLVELKALETWEGSVELAFE